MFKKVWEFVKETGKGVVAAVVGAVVVAKAGVAGATAVYDPIVTAADISGLSTTQITMLAVVILIPLGFAGYSVIRRSLGKAGR